MAKLGMKRCKTDANLYCHESRSLYVLWYVDDIQVCGNDPLIDEFLKKLSEEVLLKVGNFSDLPRSNCGTMGTALTSPCLENT